LIELPPSLTGEEGRGIDCRVKLSSLISSLAAIALAGGGSSAQGAPPLAPLPKIPKEESALAPAAASAAPADVVAAAVTAVAALGDEVVLGRYQVALERMNPQWKERTAKRMKGGIAELEKELGGVAKQMVQQGISMISFKPQGLPRSFEVGPGRKVEKVNGQDVESLVFSKWLVIIPTVTKFRIIRPGDSKAVVIESIGFQVAISDKGKNDWTFIDGSGLTVNDLRGLFVNLPQDLQFPPLEKRESR
jgi:hypothetical protein